MRRLEANLRRFLFLWYDVIMDKEMIINHLLANPTIDRYEYLMQFPELEGMFEYDENGLELMHIIMTLRSM